MKLRLYSWDLGMNDLCFMDPPHNYSNFGTRTKESKETIRGRNFTGYRKIVITEINLYSVFIFKLL